MKKSIVYSVLVAGIYFGALFNSSLFADPASCQAAYDQAIADCNQAESLCLYGCSNNPMENPCGASFPTLGYDDCSDICENANLICEAAAGATLANCQ